MITGLLNLQVDKTWNAFWTGGISNPQGIKVIGEGNLVGRRELLTVFDHMKSLGQKASVFEQYKKRVAIMIPSPRLLKQLVQMIDKIQMNNRDTKADLSEYLLYKIAPGRTNGQFRTLCHIRKLWWRWCSGKTNILCAIRAAVGLVSCYWQESMCTRSMPTGSMIKHSGSIIIPLGLRGLEHFLKLKDLKI